MPSQSIDPATGFLDRRSCFDLVTQLTAHAVADGRPFASLWIALDRLKQVNASFGHLGGDTVISEIARRLREKSGGRAEWCRMGGDEFVCLAPGSNLAQARQLALDLLQIISAPLRFGDLFLHPSASIGIAILESDENPLAFLERVDRAMMAAKRQGGGRVVASDDESVTGRQGVLLAREELAIEN